MHFFVQLCRQNNQSENSKVLSAFKSPIKTYDNILGTFFFFFFFSHNYRVIEISKFCIQTGSVQNGWKFPVAKWTELAL